MAIEHKGTGKYIKVVRELTEFRPNSVVVYYYEFGSRADRDEYFKRKKEIHQFLAKGDVEFSSTDVKAVAMFKSLGIDPSTIKTVEELPKEISDLIVSSENMLADLNLIRFNWDKPSVQGLKFKNKGALVPLGFKEEWLVPLNFWALNAMETGAYTNQTFSFDCLYKELKNVFKVDFEDC